MTSQRCESFNFQTKFWDKTIFEPYFVKYIEYVET